MSAYTNVQTELKDRECLLAALREMGYRPCVYDSPQRLQDYVGQWRKDRAEIIIPRDQLDQASNDIGFKLQADSTYAAIISEYDRDVGFGDEKVEELHYNYNLQKSLRECRMRGLKVQSVQKTKVNGKFHARITAGR